MLEPHGGGRCAPQFLSAGAASLIEFSLGAYRLRFRLLLMLASVMHVGCGEERHGPELVPVTGTVTYNDEPVEGATLVFFPQDHKYAATAKSDADGKFRLRTVQAKPDDGAVPGAFKVTVRKNYMTPENREIWELPRPYGFVGTTNFTADVANVDDEQTNDFAFDLVGEVADSQGAP